MNSRETFNNLSKWLEEAKNYGNPHVTFMLIGNKCDREVERQVTFEEGQRFAEENNLFFIETSAKTAVNVDDVPLIII